MQICISNANLHDCLSRPFFQTEGAASLSGLFGGKGFSAFCGNGGGAVPNVEVKSNFSLAFVHLNFYIFVDVFGLRWGFPEMSCSFNLLEYNCALFTTNNQRCGGQECPRHSKGFEIVCQCWSTRQNYFSIACVISYNPAVVVVPRYSCPK